MIQSSGKTAWESMKCFKIGIKKRLPASRVFSSPCLLFLHSVSWLAKECFSTKENNQMTDMHELDSVMWKNSRENPQKFTMKLKI